MFLLGPQQQLPILTNLCKMRQENLPHPADIDLEKNVLHLTDARYHGSKAVRQAARLTPGGWWHRWPPLPLPDREYLGFRLETMYGGNGRAPEAADVLAYLSWCKREHARKI